MVIVHSIDNKRTVEEHEITQKFLGHVQKRAWIYQDAANDIIRQMTIDSPIFREAQETMIAQSLRQSMMVWDKHGDPDHITSRNFYIQSVAELFCDNDRNYFHQYFHIVRECMNQTLVELVSWSTDPDDVTLTQVYL